MRATTEEGVRWAVLRPLIDAVRPRARTPHRDLRRTIAAIIWRHRNGATWRRDCRTIGGRSVLALNGVAPCSHLRRLHSRSITGKQQLRFDLDQSQSRKVPKIFYFWFFQLEPLLVKNVAAPAHATVPAYNL